MLGLVGELQQHGLVLGELRWRLSERVTRDARQGALTQAIQALRGRADAAAALLDLQFDAFKEVRLDSPRPSTAPRAVMAVALNAASGPPPSVESADIQVTATAEADVLLKPH